MRPETRPRGSSISLKQKLVFSSVFTIVVAALLGGGALFGHRLALRRFERTIRRSARGTTFENVLIGATREMLAPSYLDPQTAFEEMHTYAWVVPNVPTPFVGHAPRPGRHANAIISSQQFRHTAELAMPKPAGTYRIFFTGGSTAFGFGAPGPDRTISGYLQQRLDRELTPRTGVRYEVVNAANAAWASTHERIWIENRLCELDPDLVVAFSGVNDAHWGIQGRNVLWFRSYSDGEYWRLLVLAYESAGVELVDVAPAPRPDEPVPPEKQVSPEAVARRLTHNIRLAAAAVESCRGRYVFALQPVLHATGKELSEREQRYRDREFFGPGTTEYYRRAYDEERGALAGLSEPVRFVDLSGVFDDRRAGEEIFLDSYHFGDRGNGIIAAALYSSLLPLIAAE